MNNILHKFKNTTLLLLTAIIVSSCTVSYKFTGASIDYTKVKTISLETFQNRAAYQWGPMATMFNEKLNDIFVQQTKLQKVSPGGDMQFAGGITADGQYNIHGTIEDDGKRTLHQQHQP